MNWDHLVSRNPSGIQTVQISKNWIIASTCGAPKMCTQKKETLLKAIRDTQTG